MMKLQIDTLALRWIVLLALSAEAFVSQSRDVSNKRPFVASSRLRTIGAAAVASASCEAPPQAICVVCEALSVARIHNDGAQPSLISSSSEILSGLLDDYDGVFDDEDSSGSADQNKVATEKEYADQVKARETAEKEAAARQKEADKAAKAAEKERREAERALRLERERENQRLAVESANRAAEAKKQGD